MLWQGRKAINDEIKVEIYGANECNKFANFERLLKVYFISMLILNVH